MQIGSEEDAKLLTKLGLTSLQAEVYLSLAKMDKATIKTLSSITKIDRANIYRVVTRLQELDLVEKLITNPTSFRALPVNEAILMLLESKEAEHIQVKAKAKELLEKYKQHNEAVQTDEYQFALIPNGKLTTRKVAEMIDSNQKKHEIIIYWKDFESQPRWVSDMWRKVLLKDVEMRIIVFLEQKAKLPKEIEDLRKYKLFEIRRTTTPPRATVSIIDGKEALLSVTPTISPSAPHNLWMNNPAIVGLIQEYFELIWQSSKKIV